MSISINCVGDRNDLINPGNKGLFWALKNANEVIADGKYSVCLSVNFNNNTVCVLFGVGE